MSCGLVSRDEKARYFAGCIGSSTVVAIFDGGDESNAAEWCAVNMPDMYAYFSLQYPLDHALTSTFAHANRALITEPKRSSASVSFAILSWPTLVVANVGDCSVVLSRNGRAVKLSSDHVSQSGKTLRGIGKSGPTSKQWCPTITEVDLQTGDEFAIIGSRGFWNICPPQVAVSIARKFMDPNDMVASLLSYAQHRATADVTLGIICLIS